MPVTAWHEEPIYKKHDREAFDCGEEALNEFLRRYARKSHRAGRRGLARHDVPGFRLARSAVNRRAQGHGLGGQLLLAAGKRCLLASAEVGGGVLVIAAENERVAGWYASYGAVPLLDAPLSLLLPLATIETALKKAGKS